MRLIRLTCAVLIRAAPLFRNFRSRYRSSFQTNAKTVPVDYSFAHRQSPTERKTRFNGTRLRERFLFSRVEKFRKRVLP